MKQLRKWVIIALLGVLTADIHCIGWTQAPAQPPAAKAQTQEEEYARQVVELTNRERARYNLAPLTLQKNLSAAAHWMARDLADHHYFAHEDHQGRNIDRRFAAFGYTDWHTIGENIAGGQRTPEAVVAGWMHSPGHRKNILTPSFREIGVGYYVAPDSKLKRYWVQDFGSRF